MKIEVRVYNMVKYNPESEEIARVVYDDVDNIWVGSIDDNRVYRLGFDEVDEYGEYCIIKMLHGETNTFRNSHIDVFQLR